MPEHERKKNFSVVEKRVKALSVKPVAFDQLVMAERAEEARALCHEAYKLYERQKGRPDQEALWKETAALFHKAVEEAYPPDFWNNFARLKQGNAAALDAAITFLEKDPWFFRSGYVKEDLLRFIPKCSLSMSDSQRLRAVVLAAIKLRDRREFKYYCRIAKHIDSPEFQIDLETLSHHADADIQRRARWVMSAISQDKKQN